MSLTKFIIFSLVLIYQSHAIQAHNVILKVLEAHKDLTAAEVHALRPFYVELQKQYDFLVTQSVQNNDGSSQLLEQATSVDAEYEAAYKDLQQEFAFYLNDKPSIVYNTTLPTLAELIGDQHDELTPELLDIQSIMQDILDETQTSLNDMVERAIEVETHLLKLNKPKIVMAALNVLGVMWRYWGRASRAAYCSYSHVPQMTEALHNVNGGVECYKYTAALILRIQHETVDSIKEIKKNVFDLVTIYKKLAAKQTLVGKIMSGTLNLFRALRRLHDIIAVGIDGYKLINNELPNAALKSAACGADFAASIPQMIETAQNVTTCIVFVDNDLPDYEFMKPENERYWNTQQNIPEDLL